MAGAAHKFTIFDFRFASEHGIFRRTYTFWAGVAGGCFLTTASHGTDQLMVQRLLSARDERQSRTALLASWVVILVQFTLFLLIGVLLFVYYGDHAPRRARAARPHLSRIRLEQSAAGRGRTDHRRDPGRRHGEPQRGAEFAGLHHRGGFLSRARKHDHRRRRPPHRPLATVGWGVVLLAIAIAARHSKSVLEAGLTIGSIPVGALLGVFLLGVLTRSRAKVRPWPAWPRDWPSIVGIHFYTPIAWTWYVLIGTIATFGSDCRLAFRGPGASPLEPAGVREPAGGLPHLPLAANQSRGITTEWKRTPASN